MKLVLFTAAMSVAVVASAATKKSAPAKVNLPVVVPPAYGDVVLDENFYKEAVKESSQRAKRHVAEADSSQEEAMLSDEYKNLRSELIGGPVFEKGQETKKTFPGIQSADQMDAFIQRVDKDYATLQSNDAKLMALQLRALIPYKGFIFRAKDFFGRSTVVRSSVLTSLRAAAVGINAYLPTAQWKAGFGYITEPFAGLTSGDKAISDDAHMEAFLRNELLPQVSKLHKDLIALVQSAKDPIYYDNKVYFAFANFTDSSDRYVRLDRPELNLLASASAGTVASLYGATAYSMNGLSEATRDLSKLIGFDTIGNLMSLADGVSSYQRFQVMKKYPNLFVLNADGGQRMAYAFQAYKASARYARIAWEEIKKSSGDSSKSRNLIDPQAVMPFSRIISAAIGGNGQVGNTAQAFDSKGLTSAVVNGETVTFDMQAFFNNPPKKMSDFYPVSFESAANNNQNRTKMVDGKAVAYRNYLAGSANKWNCAPFKTYFPDLKCEGAYTTDVSRQSRVLGQAWGGAAFGAPLAAVLF